MGINAIADLITRVVFSPCRQDGRSSVKIGSSMIVGPTEMASNDQASRRVGACRHMMSKVLFDNVIERATS
jgi:hypothetical protein